MGTTSEKLTYLNTTKTLIKEELNLGGANITNEPFRAYKGKLEGIYKDFLANGTDTLWNNWEKVSGSGETITLNNTIEAKMDFVYKGNTSQETTTGKNLLSLTNLTPSTKSGMTLTKNNDGTITLNGTASADANFVFAIDNIVATSSYKVQLYKKGGSFTNNYVSIYMSVDSAFSNFDLLSLASSDFISMSLGNKTYTYAQIKVNSGVVCNNLVVGCQVVSDASITEFEKYTGGQPSPNPDYPQDIQVVSGDNTIKVEGKNLYGNAILTSNSSGSNNTINFDSSDKLEITGISSYYSGVYKKYNLIPNTTYTISLYCSDVSSASKSRIYYKLGNDVDNIAVNNADGYKDIGSTRANLTFTTDNTGIVAILFVCNWTSNLGHVVYNDIQLEKGSTATTYEPYQSATYPINIGNIELCKIGTYQDKIAKSTGKNLFDVSTITENTYIDENGNTGTSSVTNLSDYIEVKSNTSYTLSYDYSTLLNSNQRNVCYYNENKTFISSDVYIPTDKTHAITTPNNAKYIRISYDKNCYSIMTNKGTTALPYEPYGKVWYLNKQIGKVVLDGSEDWTKGSQTNVSVFVLSNVIYPQVYGENGVGLSNRFKYEYVNNANAFYFGWSNNVVIVMPNTYTLESFKTWLSSNNTSVYYITTPTYTEITDSTLISQLEAIKKSYNTQTSISQVNTDKPFILDVVALGELEI